jgi:hypothetical protein
MGAPVNSDDYFDCFLGVICHHHVNRSRCPPAEDKPAWIRGITRIFLNRRPGVKYMQGCGATYLALEHSFQCMVGTQLVFYPLLTVTQQRVGVRKIARRWNLCRRLVAIIPFSLTGPDGVSAIGQFGVRGRTKSTTRFTISIYITNTY